MVDSKWKSSQEIEKIAVPGDIIEIDLGIGVSHYLFNIRRGWCVHVVQNVPKFTEVIKDTTDLHEEAGSSPCRINNFEDIASEKSLVPRTLKTSLNLARGGLAHGPIKISLKDITPVCNNENIAKEFCIYWKYDTTPSEFNTFNPSLIIGIVLVFVVAAAAAGLLAFL